MMLAKVSCSGEVLGLVGTNGIGKSTALKILAGKLKPNLGRYKVCDSLSYFSMIAKEYDLLGTTRVV